MLEVGDCLVLAIGLLQKGAQEKMQARVVGVVDQELTIGRLSLG
jgi:hypothetical protein